MATNYDDFAEWYKSHIEESSGMSLRERLFMSIACDVCDQSLDGPLEFHVTMALENGATRQDVKEAILHMGVYGAYPKCFGTIAVLLKLYEKFDQQGLYMTGDAVTYPAPEFNWILDTSIKDDLIAFDADYGDLSSRHAGEVWGRPGLDVPLERAYISIAGDVAQQALDPEGAFPIHVDLCVQGGKTREQVRQIISYLSIDVGVERVWRTLEAFDAIPVSS
ncbi:MAG: carboxymuconolactone decarboxylase family protein [Calothrix sp. MO_167.B42]|nr:carboxymuconolactone decarboxylase family protein [Calothrix sp. MO_167.B42]